MARTDPTPAADPMELDLARWTPEGAGSVAITGAGQWEVSVASPLTLWCPTRAGGDVAISFQLQLLTPGSAMLLLACADAWRGPPLLQARRDGSYDDYAFGDLRLYTIGFNRTGHVGDDVQANASTANLRRLGGPEHVRFRGVSAADHSPAGLARWRQWDQASLLASVREPAAALDSFRHYRFEFHRPRITFLLDGQKIFEVIDHHPEPLQGGHIGIRNMTPGARYRLRQLRVEAIDR